MNGSEFAGNLYLSCNIVSLQILCRFQLPQRCVIKQTSNQHPTCLFSKNLLLLRHSFLSLAFSSPPYRQEGS